MHGHAHFSRHIDGAQGALLLIPMGRVHHDHHVMVYRKLQLRLVNAFLVGGHLAVTNFTDGDHALFERKIAQHFQRLTGPIFGVARFAGDADGTAVSNAELRRPEALPAHQRSEIVEKTAHVGTRLTQPKRRLDHSAYAGVSHGLIVIRRAADHVNMWVEILHKQSLFAEANVIGSVY